jgi:hypothetical protein
MAGILFDFKTFDKLGNPPLTQGEITKEEQELIPPFTDNLIATMTIVISLFGDINIANLFHLFPITKGKTVEIGKSKKKTVIVKGSGPYGCIYTAKYGNKIRGVDVTKSDKIFRNSITTYIETEKKVINSKISATSIQMCGGTNIKDGNEITDIIIKHIYDIKDILTKIDNNYEEAVEAMEYILEISKGEPISREKETNISDRIFTTELIDDYICEKINKHHKPPSYINIEFFNFFSKYNEQQYHSDFRTKLEWILKTKDVINGIDRIAPRLINTSMVNINYKLGFSVNRFLLALYFDKQDGLFVKFNNSIMPYAAIEIPFISKVEKTKNKDNKIDYHTIIVYKSGSVTQSGQGGKPMEDAYCRFMRNVIKYKEELIKPEWIIFLDPSEIDNDPYFLENSEESLDSVSSVTTSSINSPNLDIDVDVNIYDDSDNELIYDRNPDSDSEDDYF